MRVKVNNLTYSYGQKLVLNDLSFTLGSGDCLQIVGKNGSGKSTLVKCLLGILKVPQNMIYLDDVDIYEIRKFHNIAYVPQIPEFNYEFPITVQEVLSTAYRKRHHDSFYKSIINSLDINKFYYDNVNNLSGGQLQRVFIARALLCKPKLLILDEPTNAMDADNYQNLEKILINLKSLGTTIIFVTHDRSFGSNFSNYVLRLKDNYNYEFEKIESVGE